MKISPNGIAFLKEHEGLRLQAYRDSVGKPTIGYGNTRMLDGTPVRMGQVISKQEAEDLFAQYVQHFAEQVDVLVKSGVNQNQFDALVAFAYNIGIAGFKSSTALKLVNDDPNDLNIRGAMLMWNKGTIGGKRQVIKGLTNRRLAEIHLYFS